MEGPRGPGRHRRHQPHHRARRRRRRRPHELRSNPRARHQSRSRPHERTVRENRLAPRRLGTTRRTLILRTLNRTAGRLAPCHPASRGNPTCLLARRNRNQSLPIPLQGEWTGLLRLLPARANRPEPPRGRRKRNRGPLIVPQGIRINPLPDHPIGAGPAIPHPDSRGIRRSRTGAPQTRRVRAKSRE